MAAFQERLANSVRELCPDRASPLAVAASGGVDSTVLLRSLHQLGVEVIVLHVDHGLRTDGAADAAFVREISAEMGLPFEHLTVTVGDGNRQHEARVVRYGALADAAVRHGCSAVVTGHTATDQAETVLMHLIRGAGLRGLAGMEVRRTLGGRIELVRPMLWTTREEVVAEALREGWTWREDASNATDAYRRNRIRRHVLPLLVAEGGPDTVRRIAASANAARAALPDLTRFSLPSGQALALDAMRAEPDRAAIWVEALAAWAPEVRRTANLIRQLDGLVNGAIGRHVPVGKCVAWRDRDAIRFAEPAERVEHGVTVGDPVRTALGTLELAEWGAPVLDVPAAPDLARRTRSPSSVLLDAKALRGTLSLRTWQPGDRIAPLGMDGTKLVSDVLTERRVRPSERDRQLVLCIDDRVAWVVGHRLAVWAGMSDRSQRLVHATWEPRVSVG